MFFKFALPETALWPTHPLSQSSFLCNTLPSSSSGDILSSLRQHGKQGFYGPEKWHLIFSASVQVLFYCNEPAVPDNSIGPGDYFSKTPAQQREITHYDSLSPDQSLSFYFIETLFPRYLDKSINSDTVIPGIILYRPLLLLRIFNSRT